ncbi:hypothetical protein, partial [Alienimonas chondri]|uniref:hypothetical protein n=1 Tax=Alienimonas chondri TaxID=2681879 RepID=UPI001489896A
RSAGLPQEVAVAVEEADALAAAGSPHAPAARLAAAKLALETNAPPAVALALAERAALALRNTQTTADRDAAVELLTQVLKDAAASEETASAHLLLASLFADRFDGRPSPESHRALTEVLTEHRTRFAAFPSAAAATWRLARHEEVREQRSQALPLYRALLNDPARGPAAAAGLARSYEGILRWLGEEERRATAAGEATLALARRLQQGERRAAAIAELTPLALDSLDARPNEARPNERAPLLAATRAELQLRTARVLLEGGTPELGPLPADLAAADRLLTAVRTTAERQGAADRA